MRLSPLPVVTLFAASVWAQANPWFYRPLGQLQDFLQLSDSQIQSILTNNEEYNRWSSAKQARIRQVQGEIAEETAREPLDPSALGIRYAEIETICREMRDRANEYRTRNLGALNQEQRNKLKVLEDAVKLAPVISEAQFGNLIGGFTGPPYAFTSASVAVGGSVISALLSPVLGCYLPSPTIVREAFPAEKRSPALQFPALPRAGGSTP